MGDPQQQHEFLENESSIERSIKFYENVIVFKVENTFVVCAKEGDCWRCLSHVNGKGWYVQFRHKDRQTSMARVVCSLQNYHDAVLRGLAAVGEKSGNAKLTEIAIEEMDSPKSFEKGFDMNIMVRIVSLPFLVLAWGVALIAMLFGFVALFIAMPITLLFGKVTRNDKNGIEFKL